MSIVYGLTSFFRAFGLFKTRPKLLLTLMLAPWTINLVIFLGSWSAITVWFAGRMDAYLDQFVEAWWNTLLTGAGYLIAVLVAAALAYVVTIIGAVIVAAPFHDKLSAVAEGIVKEGGDKPPGRIGMIASLKEGTKTALVLLVLEGILLPLQFVPGVGMVIFAVGTGFVLTLGLLDIPLARHELRFRQRAGFTARNLGRIFGLSLVVMGVSFLPVVNLLAVPVIVVAATLLVADAKLPGPAENPEISTPPSPAG